MKIISMMEKPKVCVVEVGGYYVFQMQYVNMMNQENPEKLHMEDEDHEQVDQSR